MLYTYLPASFTHPTRQRQFEAVAEALAADPTAPDTLLLGNVALDASHPEQTLDALVIRPRSITLLLFIPRGGLLRIPDLRFGTWRLDEMPLAGDGEADNPFQQFREQRDAVETWLAPRLPAEAANLQFISGLALFAEAVHFGPEVEERMSAVPAASLFHLLPDPGRFTRRLTQLASPEIDLTAADLHYLAAEAGLHELPPAPQPAELSSSQSPSPTALLRHKAGQLWRWLGAEDLDELDRTDSGYEIDTVAARNQEKAELEQLRTRLQTDLAAQLQAMEAREAEREQRIAQLQQQLAAAPVAPEAPALAQQLTTEQQEKATLDTSIQAYRAELESRNQELGEKIQQLETLIQRLSGAPAAAAVPPVPVRPVPPAASAAPATEARPRIGRPAEARQRFLEGLSRWRPAMRKLQGQARRVAERLRRQPRTAAYVAGGVVVLAVGVARCSRSGEAVPFRQGNQYGLLAANGDTVAPARYTSIGPFQEGRAVVEREGVFGFLDQQGQEVIPPAYDALYPYADGYARARIGKLFTFLDEQGEEFGAYYYSARDFAGGYAAVLDHRGWFYIQGPEEPAAPPVVFQEAYSFDKGLARVKTGGAFTFIADDFLADTTVGIRPFSRYTSATDFTAQGRAQVRQRGRTFYINRDGEEEKP